MGVAKPAPPPSRCPAYARGPRTGVHLPWLQQAVPCAGRSSVLGMPSCCSMPPKGWVQLAADVWASPAYINSQSPSRREEILQAIQDRCLGPLPVLREEGMDSCGTGRGEPGCLAPPPPSCSHSGEPLFDWALSCWISELGQVASDYWGLPLPNPALFPQLETPHTKAREQWLSRSY